MHNNLLSLVGSKSAQPLHIAFSHAEGLVCSPSPPVKWHPDKLDQVRGFMAQQDFFLDDALGNVLRDNNFVVSRRQKTGYIDTYREFCEFDHTILKYGSSSFDIRLSISLDDERYNGEIATNVSTRIDNVSSDTLQAAFANCSDFSSALLKGLKSVYIKAAMQKKAENEHVEYRVGRSSITRICETDQSELFNQLGIGKPTRWFDKVFTLEKEVDFFNDKKIYGTPIEQEVIMPYYPDIPSSVLVSQRFNQNVVIRTGLIEREEPQGGFDDCYFYPTPAGLIHMMALNAEL